MERTSHTVDLPAPPDRVYELLADTAGWPLLFTPTVHVEMLGGTPGHQRFRIWATTPAGPRSWTSRRELDPARRRITFAQEQPPPIVGTMTGHWQVTPAGDGSLVELGHRFTARDGSAAAVLQIRAAVDHNSERELAALATFTAAAGDHRDTRVVVEDVHVIDAPPADVYAFLHDAAAWPDRVPHVSRVELTEPEPDVQVMDMLTAAPGGTPHHTRSIRVCLPPDRIVYKQVEMPSFMTAHLGEWHLRPAPGNRCAATARHTVVLDPDGVRRFLGPDGTLAEARRLVTASLSANSATTLRCAAPVAGRGRS